MQAVLMGIYRTLLLRGRNPMAAIAAMLRTGLGRGMLLPIRAGRVKMR